MDKFRAMHTFVQIAEHGSLTGAADALGTSLPSVVRTLAALEESLQTRLFNRTTRRIVLTPQGDFYLQHCRQILADIAESERALSAEQTELAGRLRITASVRFGEMHVVPAITRFLLQQPKLEIEVLLLDRVVDLIEEGIDVAVRIADLRDSSLVARGIGSVRRVVCASPLLLARVGTPQHPDELAALPCVRYAGISSGTAWHFRDNDKSLSVRVTGALCSNQISSTVTACAAGLGFGQFFSYQVQPWIARGELLPVLTEFEEDPTPVSLVYPHARLLAARVRAVVDFLADSLSGAINH